MSSHYPNLGNYDSPIRKSLAQLCEGARKSLGTVKLAPHSQILAMVDRNQDGEDPLDGLSPKETGNILNSPAPTIILTSHRHENAHPPPR